MRAASLFRPARAGRTLLDFQKPILSSSSLNLSKQQYYLNQHRFFSSGPESSSSSSEGGSKNDGKKSKTSPETWLKRAAAFGAFNFFMQIVYGSEGSCRGRKDCEPVFEQRWWVYEKDPYAVQEFYQGEDLLQVTNNSYRVCNYNRFQFGEFDGVWIGFVRIFHRVCIGLLL